MGQALESSRWEGVGQVAFVVNDRCIEGRFDLRRTTMVFAITSIYWRPQPHQTGVQAASGDGRGWIDRRVSRSSATDFNNQFELMDNELAF